MKLILEDRSLDIDQKSATVSAVLKPSIGLTDQ